MSIEALNWAWRQQVPSASAKLVLMALADHANGDGYCWPSMGRIGSMAGISSKQVATHVRTLAALGLVEKANRRRYEGQYRGWLYRLRISTAHQEAVATGGEQAVASGRLGDAPQPVDGRSEPEGNRKDEPSRVRARDVLFETVAEVCGHSLQALTRSERGRINKATKELREVGAEPDAVRSAARQWQATYPTARLTPTALVAHWSTLAAKHTARRATCDRCGTPLEGHDETLCDLFAR